jgi:hypothetical protein
MESKKDGDLIFLRFDNNENFLKELGIFLESEKLFSGVFLSGVGMFKNFKIGWFSSIKEKYMSDSFKTPHELVSLSGNISLKDEKAFSHIHVSLAGEDKKIIGGHLFEAYVCNTVELFIKKTNFDLYRKQRSGFRPLIFD